MFKKRGQVQNLYFMIFELVALAMVGLTLIAYMQSVASSSLYWRTYYAKDTGTIVTLEQATTGNININYAIKKDKSIPDYNLIFELNPMQVLVKESSDENKISNYLINQNKNIKIITSSLFPNFLSIQKNSNEISFYSEPQELSESCPVIDTKFTETTIASVKFYVTSTSNNKYPIVTALSYSLKNLLAIKQNKPSVVQTVDDANFIILFMDAKENQGDRSDLESLTVYYLNNDYARKNEKLACLINAKLGVNFKSAQYVSFDELDSETKKTITNLPKDIQSKTIAIISMNSTELNKLDNSNLIFNSIKEFVGIET